jgi:hypothetical protein
MAHYRGRLVEKEEQKRLLDEKLNQERMENENTG